VRSLFTDGLQVVEIEAERWAWDAAARRWHRPGVRCRRLLALVETDGQGVALIDLARVSGGVEHWRICRGLEGSFVAEGLHQNRRPGTVADPDGGRGQTDRMRYPDHGALAYLDEVAALEPLPAWRGHWRFRREPDVYLDLHQLRVTAGTEVLTARAAAIMGTPEQSSYEYRAALWRRVPADAGQTTCVDLVFEPRVGPATLASAQGMAADQDAAGGVELVTGRGRHITVYWAPETPPGATVRFADGAELQGHLAAVVDGQVVAVGTHRLRWGGRSHAFDHAVQEGRIAGLDRAARTVEVEGLSEVQAGDRVSTNPRGRGHNYRVERAEALGPTRHRLTLDVSSVLGRGRVTEIDGERVELHYHLTTRTGNLHRTRLEREADGCWQEIREACNPDTHRTSVQLAEPLADLRPGDWVRAVDYVAGDVVSLERVCRG
jgi:hypothetical protein